MGENTEHGDLQDAVERSYREQWGGRRFCIVTAVVFFVLSALSAVTLVGARSWFTITGTALTLVELSALTLSFVCLIVGMVFVLEAVIRWQREQGQFPDRTIHAALSLSMATLAGIGFLVFLVMVPWEGAGMGLRMVGVVRFVVLLFCGLCWLGSVMMNSAGITMLVTRRSDLLEVNNTAEGTAFVFRKGYSTEIVKLSVAAMVPLVIFVVALLTAGAYLLS